MTPTQSEPSEMYAANGGEERRCAKRTRQSPMMLQREREEERCFSDTLGRTLKAWTRSGEDLVDVPEIAAAFHLTHTTTLDNT